MARDVPHSAGKRNSVVAIRFYYLVVNGRVQGAKMPETLIDAVAGALDKGRPSGDSNGREAIDNRERGCGYLKTNSCYVRCDVAALSAADGEIPRFVELDEPIEYRENNGKGAIIPSFNHFPGNSFAAHYHAEGGTTTPDGDIPEHTERLFRYGFDGDHYGDITSAHAHDLLMSVGKTNWESPDDFIQECRERGLNLRIGVSSNSPPPVIEPLRTRVWVIHPHGAGDGRPGIIGYSYLTRNVFTTGTKASEDDPDIPKWAENYAKTRDDFDVVDPGEQISEDDPRHDPAQTSLDDHEIADGEDGTPIDDDPFTSEERIAQIDTDPTDRTGDFEDRDVVTLTVADEDGSGDVTGLEVEFGSPQSAAHRHESFDRALDEGPLTYNDLKALVANRDECDAGATPSAGELIDTLVDDAGAIVPAYFDGGSYA